MLEVNPIEVESLIDELENSFYHKLKQLKKTLHLPDDTVKQADLIIKRLFNPDAKEEVRLVGGDITNLFNSELIKYPFFKELYYDSFSKLWLPDVVSNMKKDKNDYYNKLTDDERYAYNGILSYLVFLDSVQTNNLPNIAEFITAPEIVLWIAKQTFDESLHSLSYMYILDNMLDRQDIAKIVYIWKNDPVALRRNRYIAELYEKHRHGEDNKDFFILLIANYMLEGIYFYNGFMFFHNLAFRGLMQATNIQIKFIKRDEQLHCDAFAEMIKIFKEENPEDFEEELVYELFKEAVKQEIEFSNHFVGNKIMGMSKQTIEDYTYYLANERLKAIGLTPIFPDRENPYKHLDKIAAIEDETDNKVNMFESTSTSYRDPSVFKGWENVIDRNYTPEYINIPMKFDN